MNRDAMIAESLIRKSRNLRAPSATVLRLLDLLCDENADFDEVIFTVNRDPVLSAKLLALCNSALYGFAQHVASLEQGVLIMGYRKIHCLAMTLSFGGQIAVELPGYNMEAGTLWHHSLVTALLMPRVLAISKKFSMDSSVAYTAGLLHDIGKLVIGQGLDALAIAEIRQLVETGEESLIQAEKAVLGCDHAELGACLLRHWRIPEIIVDAIANHHNPPVTGGPTLSIVVQLADAVAHQTGASPGWGSFAIVQNGEAIEKLGLPATALEELTFDALDSQEEVARLEKV